jgi:bifunctional oligoribonuclease and PAP phosphatase NrnA
MIDDQIKIKLNQAKIIGITAHIRPDGDAIGSLLGLGLSLMATGKKVEMVLRDGVSQSFRHLEGSELVKHEFKEECDLYITVDCSDLDRVGGVLKGKHIGLVIDHHITNGGFAEIDLVDPNAAATCEILAEKLPIWGLPLTTPVARALLTGIISDTIGFRTSNTTSKSLRLAAELMDLGANISDLYNKALIYRSYAATNYWGYALARLQHEDNMVWTSLTLEDRAASGYTGNDDADLTNILSSIDPLDVAILFVEQKSDLTKVSWRARAGLDISGLAASFGGGGHPAASGADMKGSLENVQKLIIEATRKYLDEIKVLDANSTPFMGGNHLPMESV